MRGLAASSQDEKRVRTAERGESPSEVISGAKIENRESAPNPQPQIPNPQSLEERLAELLRGGVEAWTEALAEAVAEGAGEEGGGQRAEGGEEDEIRNNCGNGKGGFSRGNKCAARGGKGISREPKTKPAREALSREGRKDPRSQDEVAKHKAAMRDAMGRADKGVGGNVDLGDMPEAAVAMMEKAGGPGGTVRVEIDPQLIRHAKNQHGGDSERARGQIPLTDDDFVKRLPLVVFDPDSIEASDQKGPNGEARFLFRRRIRDRHVAVIELRSSGRKGKRAVPVTQIKNATNRARPMGSPPAVTSFTVTRAWLHDEEFTEPAEEIKP